MLYKKPKDVRYVDMAIWCDENMYKEDVDENQLFEYLWHLSLMLARKGRYFSKAQYYEDFATYVATSLFLRIKNTKQFDNTFKMQKIKSILNFLKSIIHYKKIDFEQEYYSQVISQPLPEDDVVEYDVEYSFADRISESVDELSRVEFDLCLHDIVKTIRNFLVRIPYRKDKIVWQNIYISCLLTLLNKIVIDSRDLVKIQNLKYKDIIDSMQDIWANQSEVILYHLDDNMENYIRILVREIQHVVANDLSTYLRTYIPSNSGMQYIALSEINNKSRYDWGDNINEN